MTEADAPGVPVCYRHPGRESHIRCQRCERPICPECMTPASVGFQCPECVAEGRRGVRSPRTAYGGLLPSNAMGTSVALIAINVAVWLAITVTGGAASRLLALLQLQGETLCAGPEGYLRVSGLSCPAPQDHLLPGVSDGAWWQLLTSAFTHVEILHIGFNMLALFLLGPQLELALGRARFLAVYLGSALAGSALVYATAPAYQPTVGASGAVFGVMAALVLIALRQRAPLGGIGIWIAINAVYSLRPGISWQAHLGGFIAGAVIAAVIVFAPRARRAVTQSIGLGLVATVIALTVVVRTLELRGG